MSLGLLGRYTAAPGRRDDLVEALLRAAALMAEHPECLLFLVAATDQPDEVVVNEVWTSQQAHDASVQDPQVPPLLAELHALIAGATAPLRTTVLGGKGAGG